MPAIHSRRVFLAAGPAAAVFASLSAAARAKALSSDPIFAAIACHEAANSRYLAACKLTDDIEAGRRAARSPKPTKRNMKPRRSRTRPRSWSCWRRRRRQRPARAPGSIIS